MTSEEIKKLPKKEIFVPPILSDEEADKLLGTQLGDDYSEDSIFRENVDVFCEKTGEPLLLLRRKVISPAMVKQSFEAFEKAAVPSFNRGTASGVTEEQLAELLRATGALDYKQVSKTRFKILLPNGRWSNQQYAAPVHSGIAGFYPRTSRLPYCRLTAYTDKHFKEFQQGLPIVRKVDRFYQALVPDRYAKQRAEADRTSQDFVIKGTAFTTVTVNKNWQTACHTDKGDFVGGFGNLVALRKGRYTGGYTMLPQYGVGVDLQNGDLLLMNVHRIHGNTPIKKIDHNAVRLSLVHYYRADMIECGSMREEVSNARKVMKGRE